MGAFCVAHSARSALIVFESRALGNVFAPIGDHGWATETGRHDHGARGGVEVIGKHPAREGLAALAQLFMQAAPVGVGEKPAGAVGPLADSLVAAPPGDWFERITAAAFIGVEVKAKPLRCVPLLQCADLSRRHQDSPSDGNIAGAVGAGETLFWIDAKGNGQW